MQNITKTALEASLKKLLLKKPLDKITIRDLTEDCGISRMTFYYHFKDIYDLVEWICYEDAAQALQGKKTYDTWQEGLLQVFEAVMENKPFIMNVYHSLSREQIESYLFRLTHDLIMGVVNEKSQGMQLSDTDKILISCCGDHAKLNRRKCVMHAGHNNKGINTCHNSDCQEPEFIMNKINHI